MRNVRHLTCQLAVSDRRNCGSEKGSNLDLLVSVCALLALHVSSLLRGVFAAGLTRLVIVWSCLAPSTSNLGRPPRMLYSVHEKHKATSIRNGGATRPLYTV
jgi:hypothetical protein